MRCLAEININNLYSNIDEIEKIVPKEKIIAVIKADAYGHGMLKICDALIKKGIKNFAVATSDEALKIKELHNDIMVLILGPVENEYMDLIADKKIYFMVTDFEEIEFLEKTGTENSKTVDVFIKIDTGMGRVGFQESEVEQLNKILKNVKHINPIGIFSHFSSSDSDKEYTKLQERKFKAMCEKISSGIPSIRYRHLHNSFGTLKFQESIQDFVRAGIIIYGGVTDKETAPYKFKPVMSLFAKISYIKTLKEDSFISYGNTYLGKAGKTYATVSIGYADGVRRDLSNKGHVFYKGHKCEIVGRVCMDQLMILLPDELKDMAKKGDVVEFFGENISVVEVAELCGTISYEILCGISQRVPRIYVEK